MLFEASSSMLLPITFCIRTFKSAGRRKYEYATFQSEAAWEDVSDNVKTASDVDEILYLGYMYLVHHLRLCLLFLVVCLEGHKLYVSTLVRLRVAEGFMNESGCKSLEETGEEYVEVLVRRGLVSGNWYKSNGRSTKKIMVHDLIRGMCIRQAHTDNFILHLDRDTVWSEVKEIIRASRRLSSFNYCDDFLSGVYGSTIRTLFFSFQLPYRKGPTSAALENLQTLSTIVDFVCSREILKMFPKLRKLALLYTKNWKDVVEDFELHNLTYLRKLEILKIETSLSIGEEVHKMKCATFPLTLKKLSLRGLQLSWEEMKMVASLPYLQALKLRNCACVGDRREKSEGGFSRLVFLRIEESNLENWITKSSHFPRLWQLEVVRCSSLLEVPYEMAEIPTLKYIYLDDSQHNGFKKIDIVWDIIPFMFV